MWKVTAISKLVNKCIEPFAIKIVKFIVCWLKKYPFCGIWGVKHCQKYDVWKKNQTIVALNVYFYLTDISASTSWLFHFGWEHLSDGREDACDQTQDEMCCSWEWARSNLKLKHPKGFLPCKHCWEANSPENHKESQGLIAIAETLQPSTAPLSSPLLLSRNWKQAQSPGPNWLCWYISWLWIHASSY